MVELSLSTAYFFRNEFPRIPSDAFPIEITESQYSKAVNLIYEMGKYVPSPTNPEGRSHELRMFLNEGCLIQLIPESEIHEGRESKIIKLFGERRQDLDRTAEKLMLPLPQWHLRKQ